MQNLREPIFLHNSSTGVIPPFTADTSQLCRRFTAGCIILCVDDSLYGRSRQYAVRRFTVYSYLSLSQRFAACASTIRSIENILLCRRFTASTNHGDPDPSIQMIQYYIRIELLDLCMRNKKESLTHYLIIYRYCQV